MQNQSIFTFIKCISYLR